MGIKVVISMPFYIPYSEDYLAHSGTKGMKWGVRRWQNKDGSLTEAGRVHYGYGPKRQLQKKYGGLFTKKTPEEKAAAQERKALVNQLRKAKTTDEIESVIIQKLNNDPPANEKAFLKAYKDAKEADDRYESYYDAAYSKISQKAYEDTLEWFRKNDKDFLDDIISRNDGSDKDLDRFHDFRKLLEGYEDEALENNDRHAGRRIVAEMNAASDRFHEECAAVRKELFGEHYRNSLKADDAQKLNVNLDDVTHWALMRWAQNRA